MLHAYFSSTHWKRTLLTSSVVFWNCHRKRTREAPMRFYGAGQGHTLCIAIPSRHALSEMSTLPSTRSTRQSLKNTRQRLCRVWHSANKARQTVHRQSLLYRVFFLGHSTKRFAECQGALGKEKRPLRQRVTETASFAECHGCILCRVSSQKHSAKNPPGRVLMSGSLPSATCGTRQSVSLCRVPETLHSAKNLYRCLGLGSLPSASPRLSAKIDDRQF
jgi:hypothetical protein